MLINSTKAASSAIKVLLSLLICVLVCYKAANNEQFDDFCDEMQEAVSEGKVNTDVMSVVKQIAEKKVEPQNEEKVNDVNMLKIPEFLF